MSKPGHYWHPERRKWLPIVVKGKTTGPEKIPPACADCSSPPFEHCKCWPNANAMPSHSERIEDEQLALWEGGA